MKGFAKRLGLIIAVPILAVVFLAAWILALAWAAVGWIPCGIIWLFTGRWYSNIAPLELLIGDDYRF